jgi:hypothetical protein
MNAKSFPIGGEDIVVAFTSPRARVQDATSFRSTWLSSSLLALRERNLTDRYLTLLPREHHQAVLESVAGVWLPIDVAVAHYTACDGLGLSRREAWDLGVEVTRKVHGTSLALAIRLAKNAGVTPWSILAQLNRLWERVWRGGGVAVYRRGPKEAVIEVIQWRCAGIRYVRDTMPAVVHGIVEMFCKKAYVTDVASLATTSSLGMKVQWV